MGQPAPDADRVLALEQKASVVAKQFPGQGQLRAQGREDGW